MGTIALLSKTHNCHVCYLPPIALEVMTCCLDLICSVQNSVHTPSFCTMRYLSSFRISQIEKSYVMAKRRPQLVQQDIQTRYHLNHSARTLGSKFKRMLTALPVTGRDGRPLLLLGGSSRNFRTVSSCFHALYATTMRSIDRP